MQWLSADLIFDGKKFIENIWYAINDEGYILNISKNKPNESYTHLQGLVMPGMINAHCHTELSHLKGKIEKGTGLMVFLEKINHLLYQEQFSIEEIQTAIIAADKEMTKNGIVWVGDICNHIDSLEMKKKSKIQYHNFIECIGSDVDKIPNRFFHYSNVCYEFQQYFSASLSLHAIYSCHETLYQEVATRSNFVSIHNQESEAENDFFMQRSGGVFDLYKKLKLNSANLIPKEVASPFEINKQRLSAVEKKLFVHNTYTSKEDIAQGDESSYWCFCPHANIYIENKLASIENFLVQENNIVLGTDSLASNDELNLLSEINCIAKHFPHLPIEKMLQWASYNAAQLFDMDALLGSFALGKKPGFVQIEDFDIENKKLLSTNCKRII